jgi:hypothetical protein
MCERCREYNAAAVDYRNQAMKAETRLAELQEAVRWERECEWVNDLITEQYVSVVEIAPEEEEISVSCFEARARVDALVGEG